MLDGAVACSSGAEDLETPREAPRPTSESFELGEANRSLKGEDSWQTMETSIAEEKVFVAMVADGHGGSLAAAFCQKNIISYLLDAAADGSGSALRDAAPKAFERAHAEVRASGKTDGTTLTIAIVNPARNELTCLNVGDSSALDHWRA